LAHYVEALIKCNRAAEALAVATRFSDQSHTQTKFALAKAYIANHDPVSARPILEKLVKGDASHPEYHYWLGQTFYAMHNYSKAKSEFEQALRYRQDYLEATYFCALSAVKLGKAEGARSLFNELTLRTSAEWKAKGLLGMGVTFTAQQKPEAAESFFRRSQELHETAEAEALLALSRRRLGGPEMWVAQAKKAYSMDPAHPKAVEAMGEALIVQGNKAQALDLFKKALETNPGSCELLTGLAKSEFLTGAYDAVKSTSSHAMAVCPQDPFSYYYAALTSEKLQNRKEAAGYFKGFKKAGGDIAMLPQEFR
jgi:tetratricopeptide (TPR) repeat protein